MVDFLTSALPREVLLMILRQFSLARLRMLKAVSRAMANACRATLRGEDWQNVKINKVALDAELKTHRLSIKFPFAVSFFDDYFPDYDQCIATVHELKLACVHQEGYLLDYEHARGVQWQWNPNDRVEHENTEAELDEEGKDYRVVVTDMCIEVHGEGVCGSEDSLRRTLQAAVRARALDEHADGTSRENDYTPRLGNCSKNNHVNSKQLATALCVKEPVGIDCAFTLMSTLDAEEDSDEEIGLPTLLRNAVLVTNIAKGFWWVHEKAHAPGMCESVHMKDPVSLWSMACQADAPYALLRGPRGTV